MRTALTCAALFAFAAAPLGAPAQTVSAKPPAGTASPKLAPMDELFGRYGQSVFEIENRLATIDRRDDTAVRADTGAIDYVADGALGWEQRYPDDPWLAKALAHLVKLYARAGLGSCRHAVDGLDALATAFPQSPAQGEALLALWEHPDGLAVTAVRGSVSGQVVAAATGAPVSGAIVTVAPGRESSDLNATPYATTGGDGAFSLADVPLGSSEYILVEPPRGTTLAAYHGKFDPVDGKVIAGVIRLAVR
jgi:hypothetical protein